MMEDIQRFEELLLLRGIDFAIWGSIKGKYGWVKLSQNRPMIPPTDMMKVFRTMYQQVKKHPGGWDRKNNPEPWNNLGPTYQYKLVAVTTDYEKEGPDF